MDDQNTSQARLQKKQEFYAGLDSSTDSDDETPDPGRQSSVQAMSSRSAPKQEPANPRFSNSNRLARSIPDSRVVDLQHEQGSRQSGTKIRQTSSANANTAVPSTSARQTLFGKYSKPTDIDSSTVSKATSKRKRSNEVRQVSVDRQIFKGLHFYFFPNNDVNPARKMRIAKASEFGATWQQAFNGSVTHIIVDKSLNFSQLLKFLKKETLPTNIVVASENYPAECISYRALLSPRLLQFNVKGCDQVQASRPGSKPADQRVVARPQQTPPAERNFSPSISSEASEAVAGLPVDSAPAQPPTIAKSEHGVQSTEEFESAIRQARELQNVPFDNDDERVSRPTSSEGEGPDTDDDEQPKDVTLLMQRKSKGHTIQDKFQCMQKHAGSKAKTPNAGTIAILQQMADYYGQTGDEWRTRAYRKAISTLRNHQTKVWTKDEALALPQIGERLATKIEEIAFTNRLRRLENTKEEPSDQILRTFMKVYGAGYAQASKWVNAGYTTLDELLEKADLTANQKVGIQHYEDFNSRIPRSEVQKHGDVVRRVLQEIDPAFEVIVGGSYRRGSETSSDIDCIITRPETTGAHIREIVLDQLVPKLFAKKFLVAELAATSRDDGTKWHGASQLPMTGSITNRNPWRRIDLLLVPSAEIGAALIYFTGNDIFNRSMRLLAGTKGMRLNQRGLYKDVIRGKGREKLSEGTLVEAEDEKRIFDILGVPWRPPEHRIC